MYDYVFALFTTLYGDPTLCRTPIVYSRVLLLAFHANSSTAQRDRPDVSIN